MKTRILACVAALALLASGCASTGGGSHFENTVYDTNRLVRNLDSGLSGSVEKLNETSAELIARVNESDQQIEFRSRWLRLAVARDRPHITFLSWDSLGKGNVKANLLRSGESGGWRLSAPIWES